MRKKRTRALTLFLAVGLTAGLYTAPGAKVYAEEENGQQVVAVEETIPDDDSTPGGASEEGSNGISEEQLTEETTENNSEKTSEEAATLSTEAAPGEESTEQLTEAETEDESEKETSSTETEKKEEKKAATAVPATPASVFKNSVSTVQSVVQDEAKEGWVQKSKKWYYYEDGKMVTGFKKIEGSTYYFGAQGAMQTGWKTINDNKYYFKTNGVMAVGWTKISGSHYYFNTKGIMLTGWQKIDNEKYYFNADGVMQTEIWKDNLWLRDDGTATNEVFSREYMTSKYYTRLQSTLKSLQNESDIMKRVLAIAQSQEGYRNYAMAGYDPETESANGYLWTGTKLRFNGGTGNTEYTRWAQRYVTRRSVSSQYADCDWCAIFTSWCLYQAGIYSGNDMNKKEWYYSYCADPRIEKNSILTSFNCDQAQVWYTPTATKKIAAYEDWNEYVHTEVDAYDIPYRPGGMIFFSWDGTGRYFSHVGIVVKYDPEKHILTYISGNCSGTVLTYDIYYDKYLSSGPTGHDSIMAYAEYYEGREAWKIKNNNLYYSKNGKNLTGWQKIDGKQYYFDANGKLRFGWLKSGGNWYYMNSAGYKTTGWRKISGKTYYFDSNGKMVKGAQTIDGKKYKFASSGYMLAGGWWNGYRYEEDGQCTYKYKGSWHQTKKGWWFGDTSGWKAKGETVKINGVKYTFDEKGYWNDPNKKDDPKDDPKEDPKKEDPKKEEPKTDHEGKWHKNKKGWWYGDSKGWYAKDETLTIKGVRYTFDKNGHWVPAPEKEGKWHKSKKGWWYGTKDGWYAKGQAYAIKEKIYYFDNAGYWIQ